MSKHKKPDAEPIEEREQDSPPPSCESCGSVATCLVHDLRELDPIRDEFKPGQRWTSYDVVTPPHPFCLTCERPAVVFPRSWSAQAATLREQADECEAIGDKMREKIYRDAAARLEARDK